MKTGWVPQVLSVSFFSAAALSPRPLIASSFALIGLALLVTGEAKWGLGDPGDLGMWAGVVAIAVLLAAQIQTAGPLPQAAWDLRPAWIGVLAIACVSVALSRRVPRLRWVALFSASAAIVGMTAVMAISDWDADVGVDVYLMHQAAGGALLAGENPYGEAVQVFNSSPFAPEGSTIVGYPYPPVVLMTYGLTATFADPRIISLIAWFGVVGWFASRSSRGKQQNQLPLCLFLLVVSAPVWLVVWHFGWTEPLSLGLLVVSAIMWRRRPVVSAIILGFALASKQYFVFLVPILLLYKGEGHWRRSSIALGTAALTLVPPLLIDPQTFLTAIIGNLAGIGFRPDTQSLSGLLSDVGIVFYLPTGLWIIASLAIAVMAGRRARTPSEFLLKSAVVLGVSFQIGQAFPNYWFLIMGMTAIAAVLMESERAVGELAASVAVTPSGP